MRCKSPETQRKFFSRNAIQASSAIAHVVECGYFLAGTVNSPGNYHWPDCRLPRPRPLWSGRCRQIGQFSFLRTQRIMWGKLEEQPLYRAGALPTGSANTNHLVRS